MHLPLPQLSSALGLEAWLKGGSTAAEAANPLVAAAHPSGAVVALARGAVLAVVAVQPDQGATQQQHVAVHHSKHSYTAAAWFVQLQARRSGSGQQRQQQQQSQEEDAGATAQQQQQQPRCSDACQSLLECEALLSGTADGHLQVHAATGQLLFKQRLSAQPVRDILVRPHCSGLGSSEPGEEVCVCFSNALVRINSLDLRAQVRMLQLVQSGTSAPVGVSPLPYVRYDLPAALGPRVSGLSFGPLPTDLYTLLASSASSSNAAAGGSSSQRPAGKHKVCIVTVGRSPCLAAFEADEHPSRSTLAALVGMASSLTSGVMGAARNVAGLGPTMMYKGVRSLVKPLSSWVYGGGGAASLAAGLQTVISFDDVAALPKAEGLTLTRQLRDDDRVLQALVPAPLGGLLVCPDNLGRVLLLDGADMVAVRVWKGYRDAQCGWLLPPPSHPASALGVLLVLYAPKRQVLEVWQPRSGQRLAARGVSYPCLLLGVGLPCGSWGNQAALGAWLQACGSATTLVLNVQTGEAWDAMACLLDDG